ncbi:hypothetical protein AUK11_03850 [bacterium CG2_30_37_16]|nr:MAG: hypothetical protein AUK11_03850 [bacterium CG2_30_37_16]PIP30299.1 MAG: hypothetical protein COX25_05390 [bacterium (Candidatus Howlettbacteria) CG23_combo_of_CG06-09_8_20_14_all_37_9]PIX99109.1 MAG: hypothetical protein COZ22_03385 [bacterium (Candidatus Howlettbacteria) CG_4_10_14_3_um_filter_37_10]PJB07278.1 MAG: hypothetical protein CO123_00365 [bacterium (Candidatus Howlettbacteria) CG_4_9_14_3_um_filter_37_10]
MARAISNKSKTLRQALLESGSTEGHYEVSDLGVEDRAGQLIVKLFLFPSFWEGLGEGISGRRIKNQV